MNLITKAEASLILEISEQAVGQWQKKIPRPDFFVEDEEGRIKIDTDKESWKAKLNNASKKVHAAKTLKGMNKKKELKKIVSLNNDNVDDDIEEEKERDLKKVVIKIPEGDTELSDLNRRAAIASLENEIFSAKIKEEKSKQEEIKTLEVKKELAPMYLVKHFFSFAENMIQRSYRRYQEISPELEALYLGGKKEEAVKFLLREQETINKEAVKKLIKSMKEEGYEFNRE